jgi:hypothetical protein
MQKLSKIFGAAAIAGVAALSMSSAQAWWGGPGWGGPGYGNSGWGDMFGDTFGDMDFNMSARGSGTGSGYGRGYGYGQRYPYWGGYGPYGYGGGPLRT